jgi:hypothetical protein
MWGCFQMMLGSVLQQGVVFDWWEAEQSILAQLCAQVDQAHNPVGLVTPIGLQPNTHQKPSAGGK